VVGAARFERAAT